MPKPKITRRKHSVAPETWHERLDKAVHARFPMIECKTDFDFLGSMQYISNWKKRDGSKMTPSLAKQIQHFIAGFMAAEEYYS